MTGADMTLTTNIPAMPDPSSLNAYLKEIQKYPILSVEEEQHLARLWIKEKDLNAAHTLITSHLRLAAKVAMKFKGYGLPHADMISEANIGLIKSVDKFDPDKGFRLSTYALWWIRASIQEYILQSWSLVKIGTTNAQKKLFFNLRKSKARIGALDENELRPEQIQDIAKELNVPERDVVSMSRRLAGSDSSLNASLSDDSEDASQRINLIVDEDADQAQSYLEKDEKRWQKDLLFSALDTLTSRERDILKKRKLSEKSTTLDVLSQKHKVSKERIRQIEKSALQKLFDFVQSHARTKGFT